MGLVLDGTVAHDVDGGVDGLAHRLCRCHALAGDVVARAVVGTGAHVRQAGSEVEAAVHGDGLEWSQTLVVVHCQHAVETGVGARAEEAVGGVGAEGLDAGLAGLGDGGGYHLGLLGA